MQEKAKADVEQRRKKAKLALAAATVRYNDARAKVRGRAGGRAGGRKRGTRVLSVTVRYNDARAGGAQPQSVVVSALRQ